MTVEQIVRSKNYELRKAISAWVSSRSNELSDDRGVLVLGKKDNYAENFGLQWNHFRETQLDSVTGTAKSEHRLFSDSGWSKKSLKGKLVLEVGAGAGRFTEVLLAAGALVVALDLSDAVFANQKNNQSSKLLVIRADYRFLTELEGLFDYVLAYGVAQHVPEPKDLYIFCARMAKNGLGFVSIDHYKKFFFPFSYYHPKYLWRWWTTRIEPRKLLALIDWYIPVYIVFDTWIIRLFGRRFASIIRGVIPVPCWNYFGVEGVPQDSESLVEWAILDTFDALSAKYDRPASKRQVIHWGTQTGTAFEVIRGGNGWVLNAQK